MKFRGSEVNPTDTRYYTKISNNLKGESDKLQYLRASVSQVTMSGTSRPTSTFPGAGESNGSQEGLDGEDASNVGFEQENFVAIITPMLRVC